MIILLSGYSDQLYNSPTFVIVFSAPSRVFGGAVYLNAIASAYSLILCFIPFFPKRASMNETHRTVNR